MRFLVDASMPRSTAAILRRRGHEGIDVRDIGMRHAVDDVIAAHAKLNRQTLITRDFDFADILNYPPAEYAGIVVIEVPDDFTAPQVLKVLDAFLQREDWLARLPGRLTIVESWRVRFRPV